MKLSVGQMAPNFSLPDQDYRTHSLSDYAGKWVLVYFYPKDDTPGCTTEACSVRDNLPNFSSQKTVVLGISADTVQSHKKFTEKYTLPFTLLADENKKVVNDYDVWHPKKFMGREFMGVLRTSFLIDPKGKIAKIYEGVQPAEHAQEVLKDIRTLSSSGN